MEIQCSPPTFHLNWTAITIKVIPRRQVIGKSTILNFELYEDCSSRERKFFDRENMACFGYENSMKV